MDKKKKDNTYRRFRLFILIVILLISISIPFIITIGISRVITNIFPNVYLTSNIITELFSTISIMIFGIITLVVIHIIHKNK